MYIYIYICINRTYPYIAVLKLVPKDYRSPQTFPYALKMTCRCARFSS